MTQERRRYGFVLERQCSIAKHWMAYHSTGKQAIDNHLENWQEIAASREMLPTTVYDGNSLLVGNKRLVCETFLGDSLFLSFIFYLANEINHVILFCCCCFDSRNV